MAQNSRRTRVAIINIATAKICPAANTTGDAPRNFSEPTRNHRGSEARCIDIR